jgi:hypothetical protein
MPREGVVIIHPGLLPVAAGIALLVLGAAASPRDGRGRPVLLLPDVRAVQAYQATARRTLADLHAVDADLAALLRDQPEDVFERSRQAQRVVTSVVEISQSLDRHIAPAAMALVGDQLGQAGLLYLEAARSAMAAVAMPVEENFLGAREALNAARSGLADLEGTQWLTLPP